MIIQQDISRPNGAMVWGGVSTRGKTTLGFVQSGAKINSNYYINNILQLFLQRDVPCLFSKEENKIVPASRFSIKTYFKTNNRIFE